MNEDRVTIDQVSELKRKYPTSKMKISTNTFLRFNKLPIPSGRVTFETNRWGFSKFKTHPFLGRTYPLLYTW